MKKVKNKGKADNTTVGQYPIFNPNGVAGRNYAQFNTYAEETIRQTLDRVCPWWRRGLAVVIMTLVIMMMVIGFWENWLFP